MTYIFAFLAKGHISATKLFLWNDYIAILYDNFNVTASGTCFYGPFVKLISPQVCHDHLREEYHGTIMFFRFTVPVNFLITPNIVYGPRPF